MASLRAGPGGAVLYLDESALSVACRSAPPGQARRLATSSLSPAEQSQTESNAAVAHRRRFNHSFRRNVVLVLCGEFITAIERNMVAELVGAVLAIEILQIAEPPAAVP